MKLGRFVRAIAAESVEDAKREMIAQMMDDIADDGLESLVRRWDVKELTEEDVT